MDFNGFLIIFLVLFVFLIIKLKKLKTYFLYFDIYKLVVLNPFLKDYFYNFGYFKDAFNTFPEY
jgi:hypothetical protein